MEMFFLFMLWVEQKQEYFKLPASFRHPILLIEFRITRRLLLLFPECMSRCLTACETHSLAISWSVQSRTTGRSSSPGYMFLSLDFSKVCQRLQFLQARLELFIISQRNQRRRCQNRKSSQQLWESITVVWIVESRIPNNRWRNWSWGNFQTL